MSSTTICMTQTQWDRLNQSMSSILGIKYSHSISEPYTVERQISSGGFGIGRNINAKDWIFTSPIGTISITDNLASFCRDNGLVINKMRMVAKGFKRTHRGWAVREPDCKVTESA